ncbi:MAG: HEAT repeat domain-containing protein [Bacteriovoracaceae bacterium]
MQNVTLYWRNYRLKIIIMFLCLLVGWVRFELRLTSIKQLVIFFPEKQYPLLLLVLGVFYFFFLSIMESVNQNKKLVLLVLACLMLPLSGLPLLNNFLTLPVNNLYFNLVIFTQSTICISLLDSFIGHSVSSHSSFFSPQNFTGKVTFFIELGFFLAALCFNYSNPWLKLSFTIFCLFLFYKVISFSTEIVQTEEKIKEPEKTETMPFYFSLLIFLFISFALVKYFQSYLLFSGLKSLVEQGLELTTVFSYVNLAQSGFILLFLSGSFRNKEDLWSWKKGFQVFAFSQASLFLILSFVLTPWTLVGSESLRKVFENSVYNNYKKLLERNFPHQLRWQMQASIERWSNFIGLSVCSLLVYLTVEEILPLRILLVFILIVFILMIKIIKITFDQINEFQVTELSSMDIDQNPFYAVEILQGLGNIDSKKHWDTVVHLIQNEERPIIVKKAVKALAQMIPNKAIEPLLKAFQHYEREDIKVAIINALSGIKSYEVDNFVLLEYEKILRESTTIENIYFDLLKVMSERVENSLILNSLRIYKELESSNGSPRIVANLVEVLGYIGQRTLDPQLFHFFQEIYEKTDERRIRINLLRYIYLDPKRRNFVKMEIEKLMTSNDQFDRNGIVFIIGKLKLKSYIQYVIRNLHQQNEKSSTCIISLMELKYGMANQYYENYLSQVPENEAITSLNQFHEIQSSAIKFAYYDFVIAKHPHKIEGLLALLKKTSKDFDDDRRIIFQQLKFS